jgi:ABC-2 type transport system ATP-binding protein
MQAPVLELQGVTRRYSAGLFRRGSEVLSGIDLVLAPGEMLGLVGANGSGKSTLLRLCAGIEPPSTGRISVLGLPLAEARARARIGYLPESSPFPAELTARSALELLAGLSGIARARRRKRVPEMLERVGLGAQATRALARFSKGMLRRFALAQAFLHEPDLLLLDEPTDGLDALGFLVLGELLAEARTRGAAALVASHALPEVSEQTRAMLVLFEGRVVARGAPADIAPCGLLDLYRRLGVGSHEA